MAPFVIDETQILRWSKGSCGRGGCTDESCVCAVCAQPIGVDEDDLRWHGHPDDCVGCDVCEDAVPLYLFRGHGDHSEQAALHNACFRKILVATALDEDEDA